MLGKTHLLMGIFLSLFFLNYFNTFFSSNIFSLQKILFVLFLLLGSLLPDIDEKNSIIGRYFKFLNVFFKHRGFFHSVLFLLLSFLILFPINTFIALGLLFGMISHILLDALSREGIKFPFVKKRIKGWIKVGSWSEILFDVLLISAILILLINLILF